MPCGPLASLLVEDAFAVLLAVVEAPVEMFAAASSSAEIMPSPFLSRLEIGD
jgi:hypothetical protein